MFFVGVDWAARSHELCVVDESGRIVSRFGFAHSEQGINEALVRLRALGKPSELPVAIERTSGLLVERLLAAGHPVVPIHPNAFAAARPRWGAAGAKSDPGDAFKLADYLRSDRHRLRQLQTPTPRTRELQALSRMRDDHVEAKVAATNQLAALLDQHWPGAAAIFARLDSVIALDFLERYPTPECAARLGEARLAAFLRRSSYCGRRSPGELLARLRAAPRPASVLDNAVVAELVRAQVRLLRTLLATIADLDRALGAGLLGHDKAAALAPLPRIGQVNLAQIVAEVGPILERAQTVEQLAAEVGAAPVTRASGQHRSVCFRYAANSKARKALATFADNSRHASPRAQDIYQRARARGCRHPHAIRILMRAWLRVIWACWHSGEPYDIGRHQGARRLSIEGGLT
ncbi:MAG: IS110 family transposase [Actinomycetota bacterium]|nr:IS110 family transposase [Actinomycetota bacterium]